MRCREVAVEQAPLLLFFVARDNQTQGDKTQGDRDTDRQTDCESAKQNSAPMMCGCKGEVARRWRIMYDFDFFSYRTGAVRVINKGAWNARGDKVTAGFVKWLGMRGRGGGGRRRKLP